LWTGNLKYQNANSKAQNQTGNLIFDMVNLIFELLGAVECAGLPALSCPGAGSRVPKRQQAAALQIKFAGTAGLCAGNFKYQNTNSRAQIKPAI
jgi:hypothetical protein